MNTYTKLYLCLFIVWAVVAELLAWGMLNNWWLPFWQDNAVVFLAVGGFGLFMGFVAGVTEEFWR